MSLQDRVKNGERFSDLTFIDSHTHLDYFTDFFLPGSGHSIEGLIEYMDYIGMDKICCFSYSVCGGDFAYGNDSVGEAVKKYPERVIGFTVLNVHYPETWIEEVKRCESLGLRGIKLHPTWQGTSTELVDLTPLCEYANEHRKIIINHNWGPSEHLRKLADQYRDICFLTAHPYDPEVGRDCPNVYINTAIFRDYGKFEETVRIAGADKVVFGSDMPDLDVPLCLGPILYADIDDADKRLVLGENMKRILDTYV